MEIKLIGALDYKKVEKLLEDKNINNDLKKELLNELKQLEVGRRTEIVSTSGRLSRAAGTVMDILGLSESKTLEQNINFTNRVIGMGHDSITDHDYCVFALKDVSPIVEQTLIEERFSSFTIKSRREVDFSQVGFYIPDFHDKKGNILPNNEELKKEYKEHMKFLFATYSLLKDSNIPIEDARFLLPYCYHSNIIMGMDARTLKNLIIKLTKTKYANITELKELGDKLYKITEEQLPYLIEQIDKVKPITQDAVEVYLNQVIPREKYEVSSTAKLLNCSKENIDDTILTAAIMRRYQYSEEHAKIVYETACQMNPNFKKELMNKIAFEADGLELTQVNFQFSVPLSLAILTHLTRHRTHSLITPDFVPNIDLEQYKTPPTIARDESLKSIYQDVFSLNRDMYTNFKKSKVREEDLVYFALSGNIVNSITNMDGKTLKHILGLRECTKAQWETRDMANSFHSEVAKREDAKVFETILGPTCVTQGICNEGKECCGRIYALQKTKH